MFRVYAAANLQDAHLLLGLLAATGIDARVLNASAYGALGEIPLASTYPEIWIVNARDLARAREVIATFERPPSAARSIGCASCGEDNPAGFEICWNCGSGITAAQA